MPLDKKFHHQYSDRQHTGHPLFQQLKQETSHWNCCSSIVLSNMTGYSAKPITSLVNQRIFVWLGSFFWTKWNLSVSRSSFLIHIVRYAFWRFPYSSVGSSLVLIKLLHRRCRSEGQYPNNHLVIDCCCFPLWMLYKQFAALHFHHFYE